MTERIRLAGCAAGRGGAYLFASPWIFDFTANTDASRTLWVLGGAIAVLAAALVLPRFVAFEWGPDPRRDRAVRRALSWGLTASRSPPGTHGSPDRSR